VRNLRDWLKNFRNDRKLTQEEVAKLSEISRSFYTHIEKGSKTPSVEVAKKIANTLDFEWTLFFDSGCSLKEQSNTLITA
jgi:putative transcriptional regulator